MEDNYSDEYFHNTYTEETSTMFSCDNCEKSFFSEVTYKRHMLEHKVCNLDGCTFTAHEKIIEKHIRMQHSTGLYEKIRNIVTSEDIAKWVEDRKRKYPSSTRKKLEKPELKLNTKNKIMAKGRYQKYKSKKKNIIKPKKISFTNDEKSNFPIFPFKGTSELNKEQLIKENHIYDDEEWNLVSNNVIKLNSALEDLMGAYGSGDESETNCDIVKKNPDKGTRNIEEQKCTDDSLPIECEILREPIVNNVITKTNANVNVVIDKTKRKTNVSRRKKRKTNVFKNHNNKKHLYNSHNKKPPAVLLQKLLASQIKNERNILRQCVNYVVGNNFFEPKIILEQL